MQNTFIKGKLKTYGLTFAIIVTALIFELHADDPDFGNQVDRGLIESNQIDEASGLAASRRHPGVLWTHNDSGDLPRIFALNANGRNLGEVQLAGISARDWEDIAVGPGPEANVDYVYIGDIGDNSAAFPLKMIYRLPEPAYNSNQAVKDTVISNFDTITFQYPDGNRDAETVMVDPLTKDIYVASKRESQVRVYRLPYPQSVTEVMTAEQVATLNLTNVVGGDISPDGLEILIKTYSDIYYWSRTAGQPVGEAVSAQPLKVPYVPEPQGEGICWSGDASGYYTVSEELAGIPAHLYFYPRLVPTSVGKNRNVPESFHLQQNYPNPFNPTTKIKYSLNIAAQVSLKVYDILGHEIAVLVNEFQTPADYIVEFDGKIIDSGVYFYKLSNGSQTSVRKLLLLK